MFKKIYSFFIGLLTLPLAACFLITVIWNQEFKDVINDQTVANDVLKYIGIAFLVIGVLMLVFIILMSIDLIFRRAPLIKRVASFIIFLLIIAALELYAVGQYGKFVDDKTNQYLNVSALYCIIAGLLAYCGMLFGSWFDDDKVLWVRIIATILAVLIVIICVLALINSLNVFGLTLWEDITQQISLSHLAFNITASVFTSIAAILSSTFSFAVLAER